MSFMEKKGRPSGIEPEVMHRHHVRVLELGRDLCFLREASQERARRFALGGRQDLERQIAPQLHVRASQDLRHRTAADFVRDADSSGPQALPRARGGLGGGGLTSGAGLG